MISLHNFFTSLFPGQGSCIGYRLSQEKLNQLISYLAKVNIAMQIDYKMNMSF